MCGSYSACTYIRVRFCVDTARARVYCKSLLLCRIAGPRYFFEIVALHAYDKYSGGFTGGG